MLSNYKVYLLFLLIFTTFSSISGELYKFKYNTKQREELGKILKKFVKEDSVKIKASDKMIKKIVLNNSHIDSWQNIPAKTELTIFIDKNIANVTKIKKYIKARKKLLKAGELDNDFSQQQQYENNSNENREKYNDYDMDYESFYGLDKRGGNNSTPSSDSMENGYSANDTTFKKFQFDIYLRTEMASQTYVGTDETSSTVISILGGGVGGKFFIKKLFISGTVEYVKYSDASLEDGITGEPTMGYSINMYGDIGIKIKNFAPLLFIGSGAVPIMTISGTVANGIQYYHNWIGVGCDLSFGKSSMLFTIKPYFAKALKITSMKTSTAQEIEVSDEISANKFGTSLEIGFKKIFVKADLFKLSMAANNEEFLSSTHVVGILGIRF